MRQEDHEYELSRERAAHARVAAFYREALSRVEIAGFNERVAECEEIAKMARRALFAWVPLPLIFDANAGRPPFTELVQLLHKHLAAAAGLDQLTVAAPFALAVCSPHRPQSPDRMWFWMDRIMRDRLMSLMMSARPERKVRGVVVEKSERGVFVAYIIRDK